MTHVMHLVVDRDTAQKMLEKSYPRHAQMPRFQPFEQALEGRTEKQVSDLYYKAIRSSTRVEEDLDQYNHPVTSSIVASFAINRTIYLTTACGSWCSSLNNSDLFQGVRRTAEQDILTLYPEFLSENGFGGGDPQDVPVLW